jgi:nicotinamidase-related amidase
MLFIIHKANHEALAYRGGQGPILHLVADLHAVVAWADANGVRWAFSTSNAGAKYTEFNNNPDRLHEINWPAVRATDFRSRDIAEDKQAEFLVKQSLPWELVEQVGTIDQTIAVRAARMIEGHAHRPVVKVQRGWYY